MTSPSRDELVNYLLGALDEPDRLRVAARLEIDAEWREEYWRLRRCFDALEEDNEEHQPPPGLTASTCDFVAQAAESGALSMASRMEGPPPGSVRWTMVDAAMAAGVFIAASLLLFPAMMHSKLVAELDSCKNNLMQLGVGYAQYANFFHGIMPAASASGNRALAGMAPLALSNFGYLNNDHAVLCPGDEKAVDQLRERKSFKLPLLIEIDRADLVKLQSLRKQLGSYGYGLGIVIHGRYVPPRMRGRQHYAIAADSPGCPLTGRPTRNHGGKVTNVLFEDLHVESLTDGLVLESSFHNYKDEVAAGLELDDACIACPGSPPLRGITPLDMRIQCTNE
ncbi:MAG: hypothetical protein U0836_19200 [Pirellulales bacterium]